MPFQPDQQSTVGRFSQFASAAFRKVRSPRFLEQLFEQCALLEKWLEEQVKLFPCQRHMKFELFHHALRYPFGKKPVIGILAIINPLEEHELFEESHLYSAISNLYPKAQKIDHSFLNFTVVSSPCHFIYLEINSLPGEEDEISTRLKKRLPSHAKERIQRLIPALFARPNQEELFHKLSLLNAEFRESKDMPQVVVSYEEHDSHMVQFSVIHVRAARASHTPLRELFLQHDPSIFFLPTQSGICGKLGDDTYKQGDIYSLRLKAYPFLRQDRTIDLYRARHYIVTLLERAIGPFRDFNGGLLQKQFEVLAELKILLQEKGESEAFLLENFFFSMSPISSQGTVPALPLRDLYLLLLEGQKASQEGLPYQHYQKEEKGYHVELVQVGSIELQQELEKAVENLDLQGGLTALTKLRLDGTLYLGWICLSYVNEERKKFVELIERALQRTAKRGERRTQLKMRIRCPNPCLDPRLTTGDDSRLVVKHLYEGLTRIGKSGKPELALAKSISVSNDGLVYTFFLRKACWSNGKQITAHDFEQSWKKALQPDIDSAHSYLLYCIKNAEKAQQKQLSFDSIGIEVIDSRTLQVTLEYPTPIFTEITANWAYYPTYRQADGEDPAWAEGTTLVSSGPYLLQNRRYGKELVLVKNESYWDANNVTLEQIVLYPMESIEQELALFRKGELDVVKWIDTSLFLTHPWLTADSPDYEIIQSNHAGVYSLYFNTQCFPFHHREFRLALIAAIDRQPILDLLGLDKESEAHSLIPSPLSQIPPPSYGDPREYLAKACEDLGLASLPPIELLTGRYPGRMDICKIIQQQWKEALGLETRLVGLEWEELFARHWKGDFQIASMTWQSWFSDRFWTIHGMAHHPISVANVSRWRHGPYSEAIEKAARALNLEERDAHVKAAEQILADEAVLIPLFDIAAGHAKKTALKGVQQGRVNEPDFRWCTFEE